MTTITLEDKLLKHYCGLAKNKFKEHRRLIAHKTGIDLSDIVEKSSLLFEGVVEGVINILPKDYTDEVISTYALYVGAKVVSFDLESSQSFQINQITKSDKFTHILNSTAYSKVKNAIEDMVRHAKKPDDIRQFFVDYAFFIEKELSIQLNKSDFESLSKIKWKVGPYDIDGIKKTTSQSRDESQFYTPLKTLQIDPTQILSRDRIIGDFDIIDLLEFSTDCLFQYNSQAKRNPLLSKKLFSNHILLQGMPGEGKSAVASYIIGYAQGLSTKTGEDLLVTEFEIDSTYVDGNIIKLKSQLSQIGSENRLILIYQDEITQLLSSGAKKDSRSDVVLELQKFMDGSYINHGNYLLIANTNLYHKIPLAIRDRFHELNWIGARTPEEKAQLFQYKLEEGIISGYVDISKKDFDRAGVLATELSGRKITAICGCVLRDSFRRCDIGKVWDARNDYDEQLRIVDSLRNTVTFDILEREILKTTSSIEACTEESFEYAS